MQRLPASDWFNQTNIKSEESFCYLTKDSCSLRVCEVLMKFRGRFQRLNFNVFNCPPFLSRSENSHKDFSHLSLGRCYPPRRLFKPSKFRFLLIYKLSNQDLNHDSLAKLQTFVYLPLISRISLCVDPLIFLSMHGCRVSFMASQAPSTGSRRAERLVVLVLAVGKVRRL